MSRDKKQKEKDKKKKLPKKEVAAINKEIDAFCGLNSKKETLGSIEYKRNQLIALLGLKDLKPGSKYHRRVKTRFEQFRQHYTNQTMPDPPHLTDNTENSPLETAVSRQPVKITRVRYYAPNFSDCNADYIGYITKGDLLHFVRVRLYDDGLFIRRCYPNEDIYQTNLEDYLSVEWKINQEGRIHQIGSLLNILKERGVILLKVPGTEEYLKPDWEWTPAYVNEIPEKVGIMLPKLLELKPLQRYELLLQTGHELAKEILTQLSEGTVKDPTKIGHTQKNLKDIVKNDDAMRQLDITAKLSPSVEPSKSPKMIKVCYN